MFKMIKKRGLSPIIASILLILVTVAAISIIASFLIPFVRDSLNDGTQCLDYQDYFTFSENFGYNCHHLTDTLHGVSVKANANKGLNGTVLGFKLIFSNSEGETKIVDVISGTPGGCADGEIRMFGDCTGNLILPGPGDTKTYVYDAPPNTLYDSVEIHAILESKTCEVSDSFDYVVCSSESVLN